MALRTSCLIHSVLLLMALGCNAHRPVAAKVLPDPEIAQAREFVVAVADKMPLWDADSICRYERVEIATVKADIAMAQQEPETAAFLDDVALLRADWNALIALDELLKKEQLL